VEVPRRLLSAIQHHSLTHLADEPVKAVLKETTILMKGSGDANAARRWVGIIMAVLLTTVIVGLSSDAGAASSTGSGGVASGSVASISGTTMEVQSTSSGQTTVEWTSSTTFSETVTETESEVAVGDCLTVTGTPAKKSKTTVTARSITISRPLSTGKCATGLGGGSGTGSLGGRPSGTSGPPSGSAGFPGGGSGPPSGSGSKGRGSFAGANVTIASGEVTAVKGTSVSVLGTLLSGVAQPTKSAKKTSAPKTQKLKIAMGTSTTLSETQSTAASSLAVGDCVSAFGQSGSTGGITATTVSITSTGGKTCSAGFGGGFGGA
jgi:hypothetical protein